MLVTLALGCGVTDGPDASVTDASRADASRADASSSLRDASRDADGGRGASADWTVRRLLTNAGLEPGPGGVPGWTLEGDAAASPDALTGEGALLTRDGSDMESVTALSRPLTVVPGETITVLVWARRVRGLAGTLYVEMRDARGQRIAESLATADVANLAGWQPVSASLVVPSTALTATVRLYSARAAVGETLWDDLTVASNLPGGYAEALGPGAVLFVGDRRVEASRGLIRRVHPGAKVTAPGLEHIGEGVVMDGDARGTWNANPRVQGTVLPAPGGGYRLWYTGSAQTGYAESADGITWDRAIEPDPVWRAGPGGVVENPAPGPRYFMLYTDARENPETGARRYRAARSDDGRTWTELAGTGIAGWDVVNATYDPVTERFIAAAKHWGAAPITMPRRVHVSTSADFVTWTAPRLALAADARDHELARAHHPDAPETPSAEIYGMPVIRYGEQYLGLPWVFEIIDPDSNPGRDVGPVRTQLASSLDLFHWSRPSRAPIIAPGPEGSWDHGQIYTGTTLITVGDEVRLYYGAFQGYHAQGVRARVGLVRWPRDRFVSWHAEPGESGTITTRTLDPSGDVLTVNVASAEGALRVAVLDPAGRPLDGHTLADCRPITADTLEAAVTWTGGATLPADRPLRLRFELTGGDLYSYRID